MTTTGLFVERRYDQAISITDLEALAREASGCFAIHRVEWRQSLLSLDGRRCFCWFDAPDLESVRISFRQSGLHIDALWSGTIHDAARPAVPNVLVVRSFAAPVLLEEIQAIEDARAWCLETHRVGFARTFFARDRKRMLCLYEAPDAESVRVAQRDAGMPFDEVWAFTRLGPEALDSA